MILGVWLSPDRVLILKKQNGSNKHYFQQKSIPELCELFRKTLAEKNIETKDETVALVVENIKDRCEFPADLWEQGYYFFEAPTAYDEKTVKKTLEGRYSRKPFANSK